MVYRRKPRPSLVGQRFVRLVVLEELPTGPGNNYIRRVKARCDCGTEWITNLSGLLAGDTKSCGCYRRDRAVTLAARTGSHHSNPTHGMSKTRVWRIWCGMKARCANPHTINYAIYGGRGIAVCDRWRDSFAAFFADMGEPPTNKHTIERIENNRGYAPDNCRWATYREQHANTRRNRYITIDGVTKTVTQWCRQNGLSAQVAFARMRRYKGADSAIRAVTEPARTYGRKA